MTEHFDLHAFIENFTSEAEARDFSPINLVTTSEGEIVAWERRGRGPVIYISTGMHGDEPAGPIAVLELLQNDYFSEDIHWLICPALNPEGLADGTRENRQGADLNRDYLQQVSDEVSAHVKWLEGCPKIDLFISLHEDWEAEGFYFYEINLGQDKPSRKDRILAATAEYFLPENGIDIDGHEPREAGWIYHSDEADLPDEWPEAIYLARHGCPLSFTFETPSAASLESRVSAHTVAVKALIADFTGRELYA